MDKVVALTSPSKKASFEFETVSKSSFHQSRDLAHSPRHSPRFNNGDSPLPSPSDLNSSFRLRTRSESFPQLFKYATENGTATFVNPPTDLGGLDEEGRQCTYDRPFPKENTFPFAFPYCGNVCAQKEITIPNTNVEIGMEIDDRICLTFIDETNRDKTKLILPPHSTLRDDGEIKIVLPIENEGDETQIIFQKNGHSIDFQHINCTKTLIRLVTSNGEQEELILLGDIPLTRIEFSLIPPPKSLSDFCITSYENKCINPHTPEVQDTMMDFARANNLYGLPTKEEEEQYESEIKLQQQLLEEKTAELTKKQTDLVTVASELKRKLTDQQHYSAPAPISTQDSRLTLSETSEQIDMKSFLTETIDTILKKHLNERTTALQKEIPDIEKEIQEIEKEIQDINELIAKKRKKIEKAQEKAQSANNYLMAYLMGLAYQTPAFQDKKTLETLANTVIAIFYIDDCLDTKDCKLNEHQTETFVNGLFRIWRNSHHNSTVDHLQDDKDKPISKSLQKSSNDLTEILWKKLEPIYQNLSTSFPESPALKPTPTPMPSHRTAFSNTSARSGSFSPPPLSLNSITTTFDHTDLAPPPILEQEESLSDQEREKELAKAKRYAHLTELLRETDLAVEEYLKETVEEKKCPIFKPESIEDLDLLRESRRKTTAVNFFVALGCAIIESHYPTICHIPPITKDTLYEEALEITNDLIGSDNDLISLFKEHLAGSEGRTIYEARRKLGQDPIREEKEWRKDKVEKLTLKIEQLLTIAEAYPTEEERNRAKEHIALLLNWVNANIIWSEMSARYKFRLDKVTGKFVHAGLPNAELKEEFDRYSPARP